DALRHVYAVNVFAPLRLTQLLLPHLRSGGRIVFVTSDASVEAYEGWGGYGSSKAALDQIAAVLAAEHPELRVYAVDPGDMNTRMHQEAFPGEDISDRPPPEASVPGLVEILTGSLASGRYRARAIGPAETAGAEATAAGRGGRSGLLLHPGPELPGRLRLVELRAATGFGSAPFPDARPGTLRLAGGGRAELLTPWPAEPAEGPNRLWVARLDGPG